MGIDPKEFEKYASDYYNSGRAPDRDPSSMNIQSRSQYDAGFRIPEYGDPYAELNEQRAAQQTALDKLGNGLVNMTSSAFTGAAESTVGFVYGVTSALVNLDSSKLWKNGFTDNFIDPIDEWTKEHAPFYYSQKEQDASVLGSMGYQNFWFDKVLGGAGYTVGSLGAGYGLANLFKLTKASALAGKALSETITSAEALQSIELAGKLNGRIEMGKQFMMGGVMAHGESAKEARDTYKQGLEKGLTEQQAIDAANTNYIMNLAITGPTDMMLIKGFINPGAKAAIKEYNAITRVVSEAGEVTLKDATLDNARRAYVNAGKKFLEGFAAEGTQEGLQYATNIGSQAFVKNHNIKGMDWLSSLVTGMSEGLGHTVTDKEGLESILVGGLIGGPFRLKGARSERLAREANTQKRIQALTTDPEFLEGGSKMANYVLANNALENAEDAKKTKDVYEAKNQEAYAFGKYVQGHINSGTTDLLVEKLNTLKQAPVEEFNKFFGFKPGDTRSQTETIDKLTGRIEKLQNLHDNITRAYGISQGTPDQIAENNWLRNALFEASFTIENKEERENKMAEELNNITRNPALEVARKNMINAYKGRDFDAAEEAAKEWEKLTEKSLKGKGKVNVGTSYEDFRKTQKETYRKEYNALVEKTLDENPTLADDITSLLADLNKNAEDRETLIKYLNALRNAKSRATIKPIIDKARIKEIEKAIKEANDKAAATTTTTPSVTTAEDSANIFPTVPEQKEKFIQTPGGEQVDVGNMTNEQIAASREAAIQEMGNLDPASPEFKAKQAYAVQLEEELNLRTNGDAILKSLRDKYRAATTPEEKRKIVEEAASKGFKINLAKYEEDIKKHEESQKAPAVKQEVAQIDEFFSNLFKGVGEFEDVIIFSKGEEGIIAREAFETLKADPDFKDKLTIEVQKKAGTAGPIAYGSSEATQHPTLGKQRSDFNIIVKYSGTPIGFITFYDTFVNKQTGKPVDILNMELNEFKQIFSKDATAADLATFKNSYKNALMFHNYVTSDKILKGASYGTVSVGELLQFVNPYLTDGSITRVQENEDFVPLSDFNVHTNSKGEVTIVDTKDSYLSSLNEAGVTTYNTSNTEAYNARMNSDGLISKPDVHPDLVEAFTELSKLKKEKKAYSRYWALVEDTGGSIKIDGKTYRWTALTPSAPYTKTDELMQGLNDALNNDPGSPEARGEVKKQLNKDLFVVFGDNGNYASNFSVDIQPDYGFTTKEGKEIPEGYTLQIFSPTFFRNKEKSGETNGIKWTIRNGTTLYLKVTGRTESFDNLISAFEGIRLALSTNGGPLVGTTSLSGKSFKNNPDVSINKIPKDTVKDSFASTTKIKRENQKLAFAFNEKALVDVTPGGAPVPKAPAAPAQPATQQGGSAFQGRLKPFSTGQPAPTQTASQPDVNQQKADIERRRKEEFNNIDGLTVNQAKVINAKYDAELLKVLQTELDAGKMMFDFTPAEQAIIKQSTAPAAPKPASSNVLQTPADVLAYMAGTSEEVDAASNLKEGLTNTIQAGNEEMGSSVEQVTIQTPLANFIVKATPEGKWQVYNANNESLGLTFDTKEAAIADIKQSVERTIQEQANEAIASQPAPQPAPQGIPLGTAASEGLINKGVKLGFTAEQINSMSVEERELIRTATSKEDVKELKIKYPTETPDFDQKPPDFNNTSVFSRVSEDTTLSPEEQINITQAFAELREMLPDWIDMQELDTLEANIHKGIITLGYFQNNIIKLSLLATVGTQYHEAFHAVFRTMLTTQEQSIQYEIAKQELRAQLKEKGISYNAHKAEYLRLTPEARNLAEPIIELLILEEYMADKFKDYVNKRKTTSKLRKFFDKVLRFFGLMKTSEMDRLFAKIEKGGFKKASKVTSRFDSPIFKGAPANNSIFLRNNPNTNTPVYLNSALQTNEVNKITGRVLQIIDKQINTNGEQDEELDLFSGDDVNEIVDKILNEQAQEFFAYDSQIHQLLKSTNNPNALKKYEDLMYLYNNAESRRLFKEEIFKSLNKFNVDETSDFSINDSEISDSSPERNFEKNQEQVGGFGSLTKAMRKYIATTTYKVSLNEFFGTNIEGLNSYPEMTIAVDPNKVYNALTKACQNQADINNVINILADQLENNGEAMHFISKFFADTNIIVNPVTGLADLSGVTDKALVQRVAKAFNLWSLNYKFGSFDPNGKLAQVIDSNRRDVDKVQVNTWSTNFKAGSGNRTASNLELKDNAILGIQEALRVLEESLDAITDVNLLNRAKYIQGALKNAGMELSLGYIKHLILSSPNLVNRTDRQINKVNLYETVISFSEVTRNLKAILKEIEKTTEQTLVNPYERVIGANAEERGAVTRAEEIAKDNALFDESVAPSTFTNAEGKTIYGLQTDTYHIRKMFEIATSEDWTLEVLRKKAEQDPTLIYLLSNPLLNSESFEAVKHTIRIERIDGLRERSISYNTDTKENKIGVNKRQTEGVTYGSLGAREYAMLPYMLYTNKNVQYVNGKPISLKPVLITVMEASNTADIADLPIVQAVNPDSGKITNTFIDALFNQLEGEHNRIKAFEQGKFSQTKILNFNYGKKTRAAEFWTDNRVILEAIYGTSPEAEAKIDEITKAESLEPYKEEIRKGIELWAQQEVDNHIEDLIDLGILKRSKEGNLENVLLPKGFSELLAEGDPNKIFVGKADLKNNIGQVYLSNMVNTFGINQLLSGDSALSLKDYTDKFKRDRGANASGANTSRVAFKNEPATKLKFAVYTTEDFDELKSSEYALGPTKIVKIYKPGTTEFTEEFKELEKELTPEQLKKAKEKGEIAVADAQGHGTVALFREIYDSLGRMTPELHEIYNKIEKGEEELTPAENKKLADNQVMLNSLKMVYYNGQEYLKLSIAPLSKQATSYKNKNGEWVAQKGLEWYHDMRTKLEASGTHLIGPLSMSKKRTNNPVILDKNGNLPSIEDIQAGSNFLDPNYFRLQQENPSNKLQGKDATQMMQILLAEQNPNTEVTLPDGRTLKVGEILNRYNELLGYRVEEAAKIAKAFITELKGEVSKGKPTIKLGKLIQIFREVAAQSGASEKLLSVLELDQNGDPLYDINLPDVVTKFEEMFNAHFNKVFSQKIPGYKLTLQSGHAHNIIYNKATGKIVNRAEYLANPEAYAGDEYGTRELAYDQPRIVNGKEVGRYAEIIIPFHFAEQFGLKPGDAIPEEIAYLFGVRIPSQDKHSAMALKIVDILPPHYGSNAIFPKELILLTGSDFDIDSFYVHRPAHYIKKAEDGTSRFMLFGNKEDSAFEQHILWYSKSDVFVKSNINIIKKSNSPLATAYKEAKQALNNKKAEIKERYKEKKELLDAIEYGVSTKEGFIIPAITNKIKAREVGRDISEIKKELDILAEELTNAEEAIALQAMRELRIPTTEKEFDKTKPRNPGALNNELLDMKIALHTNSHINKEINKTPATLRAVQDEALPSLLELLGFKADGSNHGRRTTTYSMTGLLKAFISNKAGSAAIGAAVNATQLYSVFSHYGLSKTEPIMYDESGNPVSMPHLTIDGVELKGISKTSFSNKAGTVGKSIIRRIMDTLSTLTSSMTDNGKWLFNSKMNIDLDTLSVVSYGVQQGMPLPHMIYMINNEYVNRFIKLNKINSIQTLEDGKSEDERNANARKALFEELEEKLLKEDPNLNLDELRLAPISYQELTNYLKYSSLSKAYLDSKDKANFFTLLEQSPQGEDYLKAQYKMLYAYTRMQKESIFINAFTSIIKLTKGVVGVENDRSFSADDSILEALDTLNIAVSRSESGQYYFSHANPELIALGAIPYDVLPIIQNDALIRTNLIEFLEKQEISKEVFVAKTGLAQVTSKLVKATMDTFTKSIVKRKTLRAFRRNFESYFNAMAFREWWSKNQSTQFPRLDSLLFKDLDKTEASLQDQITKFIQDNPQFKSNLFFRVLKGDTNEKTSFENLTTNTRGKNNPGFISDVLNDYDAILNHNTEGRNLANSLFLYQLARYGLQYKNDSYVGIIATNRFKVIANNIKEMIPLFNTLNEVKFQDMFGMSKNEALHGFLRRFFSDINNSKAVRTIYPSKIAKFSYVDPGTGALVFPKSSELMNAKTGKFYTEAEQTAIRNARHNYIGAVKRPDKKRSTAFPYMLKVKDKGVITLYVLNQLNGIPIKNVNILEEAFKNKNNGNLDGSNAVYVPINYTGSNIANNSFLPYSLTDEELDNVTRHIQATVGKDAVQNTAVDAFSVDEFNDEMFNSMGSTDVVPLAPETSKGSALGGLLKPFQAEDSAPTTQGVPQPTAPITSIPTNKIISGGQTGVDRIGLEVGKDLGFATGGTATPGFITESGQDLSLKDFGVQEIDLNVQGGKTGREFYLPRTEQNVINSDGTVYFASDADSAGKLATERFAKIHNKPFLINPTAQQLNAWLIRNNIKTLNIAGNRGSKLTEQQATNIKNILTSALKITSSPKSLENAKPNVAINVGTSTEEKSITNIADLSNKLISSVISDFSKSQEQIIKEVQRISKLSDAELIKEFNEKNKC